MKKIFFSIVLILPFFLRAQTSQYQHDTSIKVYAYGQQQTLAWCGGFNNPQFTIGDLNNDGVQDLVVFEAYNSVRTFINKGTPGHPYYTYAPEYAANFPAIYDYLILADYNCDGIPDLFQQGVTGFAVYKGYYNAANQLCFTFYQDLFYTNDTATHGAANAFNNPGNIPAIIDVDGDGDLDFLSYDILGGYVNYYKNMQVEMGLPCDSIHINLADEQWGRFYSSLGHEGNSLCLFDYDMDGDYDCLIGNIGFNSMHFYLNDRIPLASSGPDSMVIEDTSWQSGGTVVNLSTWPAAFNIDIDQDGKKDLLIAPNIGAGCMNYNNIWYYRNLSTTGAPNWQFQSDSFLIDRSIDLGSSAYPALFDFNKDGLPDLFIGSDGYRQPDGTLRSKVSYYLNTSTPGNPSFTLQTTDFLGINSYNFQGTATAFGDIDNDGISDMVVGHSNGTLSYFKNLAATESVPPNWQLQELVLTDMSGDTINTGGYSAPFIYDIDKDGLPDLVIGDVNGYLQYYRNVSTTAGTIKLQLVNTRLGNAGVDTSVAFGNYSAPFIGAIDSTGVDYLLMGSYRGNLYEYTGFQSGDTAAVYTLLSDHYSNIDTSTWGNMRTSLAVGKIAGDGVYYMIVGNEKGGVELYRNGIANLAVPSVASKENGLLDLYPNPVSTKLTIASTGQPVNDITIVNLLGQTVYSRQFTAGGLEMQVDVSTLSAGVYFVKVNGTAVKKFLKE